MAAAARGMQPSATMEYHDTISNDHNDDLIVYDAMSNDDNDDLIVSPSPPATPEATPVYATAASDALSADSSLANSAMTPDHTKNATRATTTDFADSPRPPDGSTPAVAVTPATNKEDRNDNNNKDYHVDTSSSENDCACATMGTAYPIVNVTHGSRGVCHQAYLIRKDARTGKSFVEWLARPKSREWVHSSRVKPLLAEPRLRSGRRTLTRKDFHDDTQAAASDVGCNHNDMSEVEAEAEEAQDDGQTGKSNDRNVHEVNGQPAPSSKVHMGMKIKKKFYGKYFIGEVIGEPEWRRDIKDNHGWTRLIEYEDGDKEDMDEPDILKLALVNEPNKEIESSKHKRQAAKDTGCASAAKKSRMQDDRDDNKKEVQHGDESGEEEEKEEEEEDDSKPSTVQGRCRPSRTKPKASPNAEIKIGLTFKKLFKEDGREYFGTIIGGPERVREDGKYQTTWRVRYHEDGQEEDLSTDEIEDLLFEESNAKASSWSCQGALVDPVINEATTKEAAQEALCGFPGFHEREVSAVLDKMEGPSYGMQKAMEEIHLMRRENEKQQIAKEKAKFEPKMGTRMCMMVAGLASWGQITKLPQTEEGLWEVSFQDGSAEDMTRDELFRWRGDRPFVPDPFLGRQMASLELFSGCGIVTQEFADRRWKVKSIDNDPQSNATNKISIMDLQLPGQATSPENECFGLGTGFGVPDFIWASPPCFTYSNLSGGKHRHIESGQLEKTREAHENNHLFARMARIMHWAIKKHPHCIVVIENPVGLLHKMPLMQELKKGLGLRKVKVDYCAFGRLDMKPTHLWTNDEGLAGKLCCFNCEESSCPYTNGTHPEGVRSDGHKGNFAAIPQPLASFVAQYVDSKLFMDGRPFKPQDTSS